MNLAKPVRLILALLLLGVVAWYQYWPPGAGQQDDAVSPKADAVSAGGLERGWSRTVPEINLTHIFFGEINRSGKPVGYHSRPGGSERCPQSVKAI